METNEDDLFDKILDKIFDEFIVILEDFYHHSILKYFATLDGLKNLLMDEMIELEKFSELYDKNKEIFVANRDDFFENKIENHIPRLKNSIKKLILKIDTRRNEILNK
jgi:hypothetical protein